MLLLVDEQVFTLVMLQVKTLIPKDNPVTGLNGLVGVVTLPPPLTTIQLPVPTAGTFAPKVVFGLLIQIVWLAPALAGVVAGSTVMVMLLLVDEQVFALVMLHVNIFWPRLKPVTVLEGLLAAVTTPLPLTTIQLPVPTVGALAFKVVLGLLIQIVWFVPALAGVVAG